MPKGRIPKQSLTDMSRISKPSCEGKSKKIVFSFEMLEKNKYFNLDMTCENWSSGLFAILKEVSSKTRDDLFSRKERTFRFHNLEKANLPCELPNGILQSDVYQIRCGKSKGGIHGVLVDEIYYIIWFDPLHNAFPDEKYGGLKVISPPQTCCMYMEEEIERLNKELEHYKSEYEVAMELVENA